MELIQVSGDARMTYVIVLGIYMVLMLAIGYMAMGRIKKVSDYYLGARSIGPFVLGFTYIATFSSASAYIGAPGLAYKFGLSGVWGNLIAVWGMFFGIVLLSARTGRLGRRINANTIPELLSERYGTNTLGAIVSVVAILALIPIMVIQFKGAGIVLGSVLGIPYVWAIVIFGVVVAIYVTAGGWLAVVWTDAVQGVIMCLATVLILASAWVVAGGPTGLVTKLAAQSPDLVSISGPKNFFNPLFLIGLLILMTVFQAGPAQSTRFISVRNQRILRYGMMFTAFTVFMSMLSIVGSVTRAFYPNLKDADFALSVFVVQHLHPVLGAVIYAGLLAAMMSSVDSFLHVVGTVAVRDVYQRFLKITEISERRVNMISRAVVAIVGVLGFLFALRPPQLIQLLLFYASGVMAVAFFVPLVFGIYWSRATKQGAIASAIIGPISLVIMQSGFKWPVGNSFLVTITVSCLAMVVISLLTPAPPESLLERVFPWRRNEAEARGDLGGRASIS